MRLQAGWHIGVNDIRKQIEQLTLCPFHWHMDTHDGAQYDARAHSQL
jgi:hypothetical protein